jgi:ribosomal protein S18 acetylase RimI-like enzyme
MNLALRTPTAADYEAIAPWIPDASACVRWAGPGLRFPFVAAELPELLAVPGAVSLCLSEGQGRPLGFGQFWIKTPGSVHLGRIIVSPHERGHGLGKVLCELLVAEAARRTGAQIVTLRASRDNSAALAVYTNLGFKVVESESTGEIVAMALSLIGVQSAQQ